MTKRVYVEQFGLTTGTVVLGHSNGGAFRVKNLGPGPAYIAETAPGPTPPTVTEANSYILDVGESVEIPAYDDSSYPPWASAVDGTTTVAIIGYSVA